jgi:oligopeptide transport system substrate-binding protein
MEVKSYSQETALKSLEAIQARWARDLGVHITIRPMEFKTALQDQQSHDFMIAFSGWIADYADPSTFYDLLLTGNGNNASGWSSQEYDSLVRAADSISDTDQRFALYQKAEVVLLRESPVIPLILGQQPHLLQPWVRGYRLSKLGRLRFQNVWLER